ncbi:MAG: peptide deformylase [Clostridia bacterium]|nr:peptide deformylase [Clostridia bacterium]
MERSIVKDTLFLSRKAKPATAEDTAVGEDLVATLLAHRDSCVGLAANMIGSDVAAIVFFDGAFPVVMYNPVSVAKSGRYETAEGCLSLPGERPCVRYDTVRVKYRDRAFRAEEKTFRGFTAQIIQHETDHLQGILI